MPDYSPQMSLWDPSWGLERSHSNSVVCDNFPFVHSESVNEICQHATELPVMQRLLASPRINVYPYQKVYGLAGDPRGCLTHACLPSAVLLLLLLLVYLRRRGRHDMSSLGLSDMSWTEADGFLDPDEIVICKRPDGSDWLLGAGSFGQARIRCCCGHRLHCARSSRGHFVSDAETSKSCMMQGHLVLSNGIIACQMCRCYFVSLPCSGMLGLRFFLSLEPEMVYLELYRCTKL